MHRATVFTQAARLLMPRQQKVSLELLWLPSSWNRSLSTFAFACLAGGSAAGAAEARFVALPPPSPFACFLLFLARCMHARNVVAHDLKSQLQSSM